MWIFVGAQEASCAPHHVVNSCDEGAVPEGILPGVWWDTELQLSVCWKGWEGHRVGL